MWISEEILQEFIRELMVQGSGISQEAYLILFNICDENHVPWLTSLTKASQQHDNIVYLPETYNFSED